jgi:hypothetical protein
MDTRPLRYKVWVHDYYDGIENTDQVCTDLLTGKEVFRYDLGDPANYSSGYGGISDSERFERRGIDRNERLDVTLAAIPDFDEWRRSQDDAFREAFRKAVWGR